MDDWTPKLRARLDFSGLDCSEEEEFLLCCIDGESSISAIAELSGLPAEQVNQLATHFFERGILEGSEAPDPTAGTPMAAATDEHEAVEAEGEPSEPVNPEEVKAHADLERQANNFRRIFETELRPLSREQRAAMAATAEGPTLGALCLDPYPKVIRALLENPRTGLQHARIIAQYHKSWVGLGALGQRSQFFQDRDVQRVLLRNNNAPEALINRITRGKSLHQLFKLCMSREIAARAKRTSRLMLRRKFQQGFAEECAGLIFATEGRCLVVLRGITLDDPTAIMICRRTQIPRLLIMNLARFPGTPMKVIIHLSKQPLVKRSGELKRLLLTHPNCPVYIKRKG